MAFWATYRGPAETRFTLNVKGKRVEFPYQQAIEVDKDTAKFLKGLLKPYTDDPKFKITTDKDS
jgi:hypothetical protein